MEVVSRDNLADYAIKIHSIKGSSRNIVASEVGNFAEQLENASKKKDLDFVVKHNPAFIDLARKLIHGLEEIISAVDAENPKPIKEKPDSEMLLKLCTACDTYDMDGVEAAMAEIWSYRYESGNDLAQWLRENVEIMNFAEIVEKLSSMEK
jgi:HPt (histidine-containing phosphotransfer) domain-containing protein